VTDNRSLHNLSEATAGLVNARNTAIDLTDTCSSFNDFNEAINSLISLDLCWPVRRRPNARGHSIQLSARPSRLLVRGHVQRLTGRCFQAETFVGF
jgi:hypothetical protein